jgi:hypothetical protein
MKNSREISKRKTTSASPNIDLAHRITTRMPIVTARIAIGIAPVNDISAGSMSKDSFPTMVNTGKSILMRAVRQLKKTTRLGKVTSCIIGKDLLINRD